MLEALISSALDRFYAQRFSKLRSITIKKLVARKNPYMLRALNTERASEIVEQVLSATLTASDETIFGNEFFEPIAREVSGGQASDGKGVDVIVHRADSITAYAVKSGTNAQNASARDKQEQEFNELRSRLAKLHKRFDPVIAASYGRVRPLKKGGKPRSFRVIAGQAFWTELTGDPDFYLKLSRLMKDIPAKHMELYKTEWEAAHNRLESEFVRDFCHPSGKVDWDKLTTFVSGDDSQPETED